MDWFAFYLAWIAVVVFEVGLVLMGLYFFNEYQAENARCTELVDSQDAGSEATSDDCSASFWGWLCCWLLAAFYLCIMCCFFKQLRQAIRVIETAADWLADTKRMVFVPLNFFFIAVLFFMLWMGAVMCIGTMTDGPIYHPHGAQVEGMIDYSQAKDWEWSTSVQWMLGIEFFGMIWLMFFIMAVSDFIVIVSAATWYYSDKSKKDTDGIPGDSEVCYGYSLAFKYHMGSLASGSLILAIIWVIRRVFEYIGKKMEAASGGNPFTKCLVGCCNCCLACFQKFVQYLNQQAYVYMAISGESYCSSALNAFLLMTKYAVTFGMVNTLADVFVFICKWAIAIGTSAIAFPMMKTDLVPKGSSIQNEYCPAGFILLFSYIIASIFIGMMDAGASTILQCYLLDKNIKEQMASGVHFDEKHISENLRKFFTDMEDKHS